jgi:hypothetical protein
MFRHVQRRKLDDVANAGRFGGIRCDPVQDGNPGTRSDKKEPVNALERGDERRRIREISNEDLNSRTTLRIRFCAVAHENTRPVSTPL